MIQTWIADVSGLYEKQKYLQYYNAVPDFRKEKADRILHKEERALSIGAWTLYDQMRKEYGVSWKAVFNLSHSGHYALCSLDDANQDQIEVGCDLEEIKEFRLKVAKRFFCPNEFQKIMEQTDIDARTEEFYRLWVLKESFMKATRQGMKLGMDTYEFAFDEKDRPYLCRQPEAFSNHYYLKEYRITEIPYRIAVCSDQNAFAKDIQMMNL